CNWRAEGCPQGTSSCPGAGAAVRQRLSELRQGAATVRALPQERQTKECRRHAPASRTPQATQGQSLEELCPVRRQGRCSRYPEGPGPSAQVSCRSKLSPPEHRQASRRRQLHPLQSNCGQVQQDLCSG